MAAQPVPRYEEELAQIEVSNETTIIVDSDGEYLCQFDDDASAVFRTRYTVLHKGRNYLTAYREGQGKYVLYKIAILDQAVTNYGPGFIEKLAMPGKGIGNPPPK